MRKEAIVEQNRNQSHGQLRGPLVMFGCCAVMFMLLNSKPDPCAVFWARSYDGQECSHESRENFVDISRLQSLYAREPGNEGT